MRDYPSSVMWRLDPLLDAHQRGRPKSADEFRVAVLGDSGSFDLFSPARDAIPGRMSALQTPIRGRRVRAYNLSYQTPNPLKDLVIEEHALRRQPDAIVWFVTLYDLASDAPPPFRENVHLLLRVNRDDLRALADRFSISTWETRQLFAAPDRVWKKSIFFAGERYRDFSCCSRAVDAITRGSERHVPSAPAGSARSSSGTALSRRDAADPAMPNARWVPLAAGSFAAARSVPILVVNDRSSARPARAQSRYTRSMDDAFTTGMLDTARYCAERGIALLDLWDFLRPEEFGDTPQHYLPAANARIALAVNEMPAQIVR